MLQAPGAILSTSTAVGQPPIESNPALGNAQRCFSRVFEEGVRTSHAPLMDRTLPLPAGFGTASQQLRSLMKFQNAVQGARSLRDVNHIFRGLHEFVEPIVAGSDPEIREVHEEIRRTLDFSQGLYGEDLEELHGDVFLLFLKLLALLNKQQEQQRLGRQYEGDLQTKYTV